MGPWTFCTLLRFISSTVWDDFTWNHLHELWYTATRCWLKSWWQIKRLGRYVIFLLWRDFIQSNKLRCSVLQQWKPWLQVLQILIDFLEGKVSWKTRAKANATNTVNNWSSPQTPCLYCTTDTNLQQHSCLQQWCQLHLKLELMPRIQERENFNWQSKSWSRWSLHCLQIQCYWFSDCRCWS